MLTAENSVKGVSISLAIERKARMDSIGIMNTKLCKAVMKGSCDDVREIIRNNSEILRGVTPQGNTALHVAAARGHHELVQLLLERKPCMLLMTNSKGETALHKAATSKRLKVVQVLLKFDKGLHCKSSGCVHGIDPEACGRHPRLIWRAQNKKGETALHYASKGGFLEVVIELLSVEGIASIVNNTGESALYTACEEGRLKVAKKLLEKDLSVPDTRSDGTSCLHAIIHLLLGIPVGNKILDWLLPKGYVLRFAPDPHLVSDLAREVIKERPELAKKADTSGNVPLHLATLAGDLHFHLVEELLKFGPDMNFRLNNDNMAPIHIAAMHGYLKISKCLVNSAPHCTDLIGKDGKNVLQLAVEHGHHSLALLCLLRDSVDPIFLVDEPDIKGNTALHEEAVAMARPPYLGLWKLMAFGALLGVSRRNVNAVNEEGDTPLDVFISKSSSTPFSFQGLQFFRSAGGVFKGKGNQLNKRRGKISETSRETTSSEAPRDAGETLSIPAGLTAKVGKISETLEVIREATSSDASKDASQTLSIIAALITTVTFAAAFTIPGGADQNTGIPVLMHEAALQVFIVCDTVAMCLSMLSLFLLNFFPFSPTKSVHELSQITSEWGFTLIRYALYPTMAAFTAGIYVVVAPKCLWLAVTVCSTVSTSILFFHVWMFLKETSS